MNHILKDIYTNIVIWLNEGFPPDYYNNKKKQLRLKNRNSNCSVSGDSNNEENKTTITYIRIDQWK